MMSTLFSNLSSKVCKFCGGRFIDHHFYKIQLNKSLRDGLRRLWRSFLFNLKKAVDNES